MTRVASQAGIESRREKLTEINIIEREKFIDNQIDD
jgi:hypothetical protein